MDYQQLAAHDAARHEEQQQAYADQHAHDVAWMSTAEREAYEAKLTELAGQSDA